MRNIDQIYINGRFVAPHGRDEAPLFNPSTEKQIGTVRLGDLQDVNAAVSAAKQAFHDFSRTSKAERIALLKQLSAAVAARSEALAATMMEEYGSPQPFTAASVARASAVFLDMAKVLETYEFRRTIGRAELAGQDDWAIRYQAAIRRDHEVTYYNFTFVCNRHGRDQCARTGRRT